MRPASAPSLPVTPTTWLSSLHAGFGVGVAKDKVRRHPVLGPQRFKGTLDNDIRALGDRRTLEQHPVHLAPEGPGAPPLDPAELGVELPLERVVDRDELAEVGPAQL